MSDLAIPHSLTKRLGLLPTTTFNRTNDPKAIRVLVYEFIGLLSIT